MHTLEAQHEFNWASSTTVAAEYGTSQRLFDV